MNTIIKRYFLEEGTLAFSRYTHLLTALTLISILTIILESVESLQVYDRYFTIIEWLTVAVFLFDYIGNVWVAEKKVRYVFSFIGITDFLAIFPTLLGLTNLTALKSVRIVRLLRLLRLARITKVTRVHDLAHVRGRDKDYLHMLNVEIYFLALLSVVLVFGSLIHVLEPHNFENIPEGMLWSARLTVAAIPSVHVESVGGEILLILNRFAGLVLFGLLIAIVGNSVKKLLFGSTELVDEVK